MGISDFSKRDYLYLAPKSYKCPFCRREHTYDKEYFDYQSGKTKNRSLASYQTLYPGSLVLKCNSHNQISLSFDPFYCYWKIHGSIDKNNYYDEIDGEGKVSLEEMEDCEDGTITFKFTISSFKNIYLKLIPVGILTIVFCLSKWESLSSFGMIMFWGLVLTAIYNVIVTRTLLNLKENK